MKKLKTIIGEDSEEQLRLIRQLVEDNCPQIAVVAEAMTLDDAYTAIKQHQPDLVLLDVEFHAGATSFNLLDRLIGEGMVDFEIVFFRHMPSKTTTPQWLSNMPPCSVFKNPLT